MKLKNILIINGSHRQGNTDILVDQLIKQIADKAQPMELKLRDMEMKLPDGCEFCANSQKCPNIKDEFSDTIEPGIRGFDTYIIVTPTYDDGVTPLTKIFWDRIVSWSHEKRKYLKGKKLAIMTHGMAGKASWKLPIDWVKSVCVWEEAIFGGCYTCLSDASLNSIQINEKKLDLFIKNLIHG